MSENSINFDDKKIKSGFYNNKNKKKNLLQMILMLIKYYSLKKNSMAIIIHLNTLLGIVRMIMMLLDHDIQEFDKLLAILINLIIKIKKYNNNIS